MVSACRRDKRLHSREESLSPFTRLTATIDWYTGSFSDRLLGMRERAQLIGGSIDLTGLPGIGTVLTVRVPLPTQAAAGRAARAAENEAFLRPFSDSREGE